MYRGTEALTSAYNLANPGNVNDSTFMPPLPIDKPTLEEESVKSIQPTLKAPGIYDDLDFVASEVTTLERFMVQGIQLTTNNFIALPTADDERLLQISHRFDLGKKEGIDPTTGQKDGERASYTISSTFQSKPWTIYSAFSRALTMFVLAFSSYFDAKLQIQASPDPNKNHVEGSISYTKDNFHGLFKLANFMPLFQYTQEIDPSIAIGTELFLYPGAMAKHSVVLRHTQTRKEEFGKDEDIHMSSSFLSIDSVIDNPRIGFSQPQSIGFSHVQTLDKGLDFVTALKLDYHDKKRKWDPKLSFGYKCEIKDTAFNATTLVNVSEKKVMTSVESIVADMGKVTFDTKIDYAGNNYDVGVKIEF